MICERPYLAPVDERDPKENCYACDGKAFRRWFDTDMGWLRLPCAACGSVATAGTFVVRIITQKFRYEMRYDNRDAARAVHFAERTAAHVAGRSVLGQVPLRVEVVYKPLDPTHHQKEEVYETVVIQPRTRIAA